ncbi:MAG TPA: hypothetical protein DDY31_04075 [Lachnospiraceae bacterium]|nr:hypothetical protein [Lachnospiraceae bacterium]
MIIIFPTKNLNTNLAEILFEEARNSEIYVNKSLFNPHSFYKALKRGICLNCRTETGPMNEIAD